VASISTSDNFFTNVKSGCRGGPVLDVHRLRIFRAVVTAGSVNRAAANLSYTPSAISQHIATLQRETGLRLIERNGRGIEITPAGRLLAEEAAVVLERLASLDSVVADLREGRVGSLSVGYFTSAGAAWIPPVVVALTREFPDLRLDLRLHELADQRPPLDVQVFVQGTEGRADPDHDVHSLLEEPYLAVVPAAHRLAHHDEIPLRELADEPWVDHDFTRGPCRQVVVDACASVGFSPGFRVETQDHQTAISFVAAGMGITVLPRLCLTPALPAGLVAVPVVDPVPVRHIAVRVRQALRHNRAARRFVELMREQVG
jgi:DNA-binding transcriptional LysR family regulator